MAHHIGPSGNNDPTTTINRPIRGKAQLESSLLFNDQHPLLIADSRQPDEVPPAPQCYFDPTISKAFVRRIPPKLLLTEGNDLYKINELRHRLHQSFERRHRSIIAKNPKSFFRAKGEFEGFIEKGTKQIDMLPAWLPRQSRRMTLSHALKIARPVTEYYYDRFNQPHSQLQEFGNTERLATSKVIRQHHIDRRNRLTEALSPHGVSADPASCKSFIAPRKSLTPEAAVSTEEIFKFERKHHRGFELRTMTKNELKSVIEAEGDPLPGREYWDAKDCIMKKATLPKQEYLDVAKGALLKNEAKPVFQKGNLIRQEAPDRSPAFCVISIYRCRGSVVRLEAHDQERMLTYRMVLTPTILEDFDIDAPPKGKALKRWSAWSNVVFDMLQITFDNQLVVTRLPIQENGLPPGFSLTGDNTMFRQPPPPPSDEEENRAVSFDVAAAAAVPLAPPEEEVDIPGGGKSSKPLSSKHVTEFFDKY